MSASFQMKPRPRFNFRSMCGAALPPSARDALQQGAHEQRARNVLSDGAAIDTRLPAGGRSSGAGPGTPQHDPPSDAAEYAGCVSPVWSICLESAVMLANGRPVLCLCLGFRVSRAATARGIG